MDFDETLNKIINDEDLKLYENACEVIVWILRLTNAQYTSNGIKSLISRDIDEWLHRAVIIRQEIKDISRPIGV